MSKESALASRGRTTDRQAAATGHTNGGTRQGTANGHHGQPTRYGAAAGTTGHKGRNDREMDYDWEEMESTQNSVRNRHG